MAKRALATSSWLRKPRPLCHCNFLTTGQGTHSEDNPLAQDNAVFLARVGRGGDSLTYLSVLRGWVVRPGVARVSQRSRMAGDWSVGAVENSR